MAHAPRNFDIHSEWDPFTDELGDRIRDARSFAEITIEELAEQLSVDPEEMQDYENGALVPSVETIASLSGILNCSTDWLLLGKRNPNACCGTGVELDRLYALWKANREIVDDAAFSDGQAEPFRKTKAVIEDKVAQIPARSAAEIAMKYLIAIQYERPDSEVGKSLTRDAKRALLAAQDESRVLEIFAHWQVLFERNRQEPCDKKSDQIYWTMRGLEFLVTPIPANTARALAAKTVMFGDETDPCFIAIKPDIAASLGDHLKISI